MNSTSISELTSLSSLDDNDHNGLINGQASHAGNGDIHDSEVPLDLNSNLSPQLSNPSSLSSSSDVSSFPSSIASEAQRSSKPPKPLSLITDINQKDHSNVVTPIVTQKLIPANQQPPKSILSRKPLPTDNSSLSKPKIITSNNNNNNYNNNNNNNNNITSNSNISSKSSSSSSPVPNLKKFVHVVRLISPDQPDEYLKVLNIPIYPDTLKIGRQNTPKTSNKITDGYFDSRVLSRNHAELFIKDNQLYIRDLKSSNGTFINDSKLEPYKDYKLSINDKIDLGTTLESQMAHKKITCIIKEFDYISLKKFDNLVEEINSKDDLITKKMELFNNTFDALLFGEIVDDIVLGIDDSNSCDLNLNDDLLDLIMSDKSRSQADSKADTKAKSKSSSKQSKLDTNFFQGLDLKPSQTPQDVVKKLITAVNNEYIQQQRLKEMNMFLKNYNNSIAGSHSTSVFNLYDKLLKNEKGSVNNVTGNRNSNDNNSNTGKSMISTPPLSPTQKQLKYSRMEDQLKNSIAELDIARKHLSTAKSNESKMKKFGIENENLRKLLGSSESRISELEDQLKTVSQTNEIKDSQLGRLQDELQQLKKKQEQKETDLKEVLDPKAVDVYKEAEVRRRDDERHTENESTDKEGSMTNNVKQLLQELSSGIVRYSGWIILSVALVYCTGPISMKGITELVSH
ncbi:hypothetical protein PMKS-002539 [Pichia membranifaciens]|uniref:FHA domain-containing protein n=1 Tax=Pichia membranifaciens TaxID=4926 RepID=A0A1Q2YHM8_9ASCO|nr:hypothetical protein PMKS-002539 [Pichia membranifaciens]